MPMHMPIHMSIHVSTCMSIHTCLHRCVYTGVLLCKMHMSISGSERTVWHDGLGSRGDFIVTAQ